MKLISHQEPDSEGKNGPENGPQNGPEMQFLFSDIYQLPNLSRDLSPDLSLRIEKGISAQKICSFFTMLGANLGTNLGTIFGTIFCLGNRAPDLRKTLNDYYASARRT